MGSWRRTLYALWLAQTLTIIGFSMRTPFLPFYVAQLGATRFDQQALWAGVISASGAALMAFTSPVWGVVSDRYGRKPMVMRAMAGGWLTVSLMALATSPWHLLGLRLVEGALTGTTTASIALVAVTVPKERLGFGLGLIQTGIFSGSAIGPLIGGVVADQIGYRATFVIAGSMLLISALLVMLLVEENFQRPEPLTAVDAPASQKMSALLLGRAMLAMTLVMVFLRISSSAVQPVLPLFVERLGGTGDAATLSGLAIGIVGMTSAVSSVLLGRLADRKGPRTILIVSALLAGLFYLPQAAAQSVTQLVFFGALFGIAAGGVLPTANAVVANLTPPERRGAVFGFTASATSLGAFIGPLIGSGLTAAVSVRATFVIPALLMMLAAGWIWLSVPRREGGLPLEAGTPATGTG
jgi:DHA1 family multidrug resistance protein-like MFS transporter